MLPATAHTDARILIVDDEPANILLLQFILNAAGFKQLRTTTDSRQVMALFAEQEPDLILLDLMMPPPDGFDLLATLRARVPAGDFLPVLALTADVTAQAKHRAFHAGASDFLTKPFDPVEVLLRIRNLLQMRAQHRLLTGHNEVLEETVAERTAELRLTCSHLEETVVQLRTTQQQVIQQERMSALGAMAAGLAHDFNNSLSLILGYSELLQGDLFGTPYEARSEEFLGTVITAAQDAAGMFNRLRAFARASDAGDPLQSLDLNSLVEGAVILTRPRWHGQALGAGVTIRLTLDLAPGLPKLLADAGELREMLINLIFNAVDAMPGGGALTLRTRHEPAPVATCDPPPESAPPTLPDRDVLVLEVADTGIGMDEETARRCLEPFFTTKGSHGTGLGLAMVYGTVQRHGGTVSVRSRVGEGTCFELRLPVREDDPPVSSLAPVAVESEPPRRILVVDDHPVFLEILRRNLTGEGHAVETAADGVEALEKFRANGAAGFDLVITDKAMPRLGGEGLAVELKRLRPSLRVILLSGFGGLEAVPLHRHPAVDVSLVKPVTQAALRAAVHEALAPRPSVPDARRRTRRIPALRALQAQPRSCRRAA